MKLFKKLLKNDKYKGYNPAGNPQELIQFVDWIKTYSNLNVKTIMEIGANFGQDSDFLSEKFDTDPKNVWVFEAHPEIYNAIKKIHPNFNSFNNAVFNKEETMTFNMYPLDACKSNSGCSSLLKQKKESLPANFGGKENVSKTKEYKVKSIRMDNFMKEHNIKSIDFLKLDAEGVNYEVLESFGKRIKDVKAIHTESEQYSNLAYDKQKESWTPIKKLLEKNGFELIYFQKYYSQADSFWIRKDLIKKIY